MFNGNIIIIYVFTIASHPISHCSWPFEYIKIIKYKYTPEDKTHKYTSDVLKTMITI